MARGFLVMKRAVIGLLLLTVLAYLGDYLVVRTKMANPKVGDAFGAVTMERLYAIPLKDGKTEYQMDAQHPEVVTPCVHALFPHMRNSPCWYLRRNRQTPIPMTIVPALAW